jgi:NAD(P)-dependent dehydrogenase (short-subunit alcohol dehydrogenase family)
MQLAAAAKTGRMAGTMTLQLTFPSGGALVAGGTGTIGAGIARRLAAAGVPVVFTYRSDETAARRLEDELRAAGLTAFAQRMDMADKTQVDAAIDRVIAVAGRLHTLANAGGPRVFFNRMADITPEQAAAFLDEDAVGVYRLIHRAIPALRAGGGGSITLCTTIATRRVIKFDGISPFSKGALEALIRQLADEEARHRIRCNTVPIGWVSELSAEAFSQYVGADPSMGMLAELVEQLRDIVRFDGPGSPDDVGNLFAFLASDQSAYITGQSIAFDGGATL